MAEHNPYAAPEADVADPLPIGGGPEGGLWRMDSLLVMHRDAPLPDLCLKSSTPAYGRRLVRRLSWHHPLVFLTLLAGIVVYALAAILLRRTARIEIGISETWARRRARTIAVAWGLFAAGVVAIFLSTRAGPGAEGTAFLILAGFVLVLFGAIWGIVRGRLVAPRRISREYVWLRGVHPAVLADLPSWPYGFREPREA